MDRALFACHAGSGVGLGHFKRALVAAKSLQEKIDIEIEFLIDSNLLETRFLPNFQVHYTSDSTNLTGEIKRFLENNKYQILCIDAFEESLTPDFQSALDLAAEKKVKIITIDLLSKFTKNVDLIYVPSFLEPDPNRLIESKAKVVFGWDCYLLSLDKLVNKTSKNDSVLILTGGSDSTNLGDYWPIELNKALPASTNIEWATGPFSKSPVFPPFSSVNFVEHVAPENLSLIMSSAKVAATIYGVSYYELLALGIPTIVFNPYGERNSREVEELRKVGVSLIATDHKDASKMLNTLLNDESLQENLSSKSRGLLQRYSGERFAEEIELLLKDGL